MNNNTGTGKVHEEGGAMNVNQLRGSGAIKQLADNIIGLTRNQLAETIEERNTAEITLLKCRLTGMTGKTDKIKYDNTTGIFETLGFDDEVSADHGF